MVKSILTFFCLSLTLTVAASESPSQAYQAAISSFEDYFQQQRQEHQIQGLSVALVDGKDIVWSTGFGFGDSEGNHRLTADTPFRIGSVTKLFTALEILDLERQGLVDIDQPLFLYLPRFHIQTRFSADDPITVRQVLTHHAGLPTELFKGQWSTSHFSDTVENLRLEYVAYPPNFIKSYSNVGYSLLGALIEQVTQMDYEYMLHDRIFKPLSMRNTGFYPGTLDSRHSEAFDTNGQTQRLFPMRDLPAMGLYSSANDLARFISVLIDRDNPVNRKVADDVMVEEMFEHQNQDVVLDFDNRIGIPWLLDQCGITDAGKIAQHGGTTMYYSSQVMVSPEYGLGVVVLSNTANTRKVVEVMAEWLLANAIQIKRKEKQLPLVWQQHTPPRVGDLGKQETLAEYLTDVGLVSIDPIQKELCQCDRKNVVDLVPLPNGWYQMERKNNHDESKVVIARLAEVELNDNKVIVYRDRQGRTHRVGSMMPKQEIPGIWLKRLGGYQVINPDSRFRFDTVELFMRKGRLYFQYRMPDLSPGIVEMPLSPITDFEAVTTGLGRNRGETLRLRKFSGDDTEYLVFSGYVAEKSQPITTSAD